MNNYKIGLYEYETRKLLFQKDISLKDITYYYDLDGGLAGSTYKKKSLNDKGVKMETSELYSMNELLEIEKEYPYLGLMENTISITVLERITTLFDYPSSLGDGYYVKLDNSYKEILNNLDIYYDIKKDNILVQLDNRIMDYFYTIVPHDMALSPIYESI